MSLLTIIVTEDYNIRDPELTETGHAQVQELRANLINHPVAQNAGLIVTSPMIRTMQTAMGSLDWLIDSGVKIEADAGWQENSAKPCDTGKPGAAVALAPKFPAVDFSTLDPVYPDKITPAGSHYFCTRKAIMNRGQASLRRLRDRPEKVIIVVSHSGFLRLGVSGCFYLNADYRIFDFEDEEQPGEDGAPQIRLRQWDETKEKGGGMGKSWKEMVELGSGLPSELPN
ncbi:Phosphoglycerate mutase-like protein [Apiospora kogelbergensis]|uniref:Phosphoglycerate mutase-like protein n=1 Tax=Apiospora kogelbergensis TaxID=1337665 RepID=UPI00312F348A